MEVFLEAAKVLTIPVALLLFALFKGSQGEWYYGREVDRQAASYERIITDLRERLQELEDDRDAWQLIATKATGALHALGTKKQRTERTNKGEGSS